MAARQTGVWTLLDKIAEDMQIPKTPQETHFLREKWSHIRWLATKLASSTFGDKSQVQQKIDNHLIISWGEPKDDKEIKTVMSICFSEHEVESGAMCKDCYAANAKSASTF